MAVQEPTNRLVGVCEAIVVGAKVSRTKTSRAKETRFMIGLPPSTRASGTVPHREWPRPPGPTAGIVRAFVEHGMHIRPGPLRLWMLGPMFRYDRPQAGRYRQLTQWDVEG